MTGLMFKFLGCVLAMPISAWLLPGVHTETAETAWIAGVLLGMLYLVARPVARLIITPLNCLTVGILGYVIDALFVLLLTKWLPGFAIESFVWALLAALVTSIMREMMGALNKKGRK